MQIAAIHLLPHSSFLLVALVRFREGTGRDECSLVGLTASFPRTHSTAYSCEWSFRCGSQVSCHLRPGLHQILRRNHPPVSDLRRAVSGGKSRWPITHMRLLSIEGGWTRVEVRKGDELRTFHVLTERDLIDESGLGPCRFSDFMQKGASLPASQLIKLITRGRTSRLSAEPLLEFFRPLEAWLELQNRDEPVSYFVLLFV